VYVFLKENLKRWLVCFLSARLIHQRKIINYLAVWQSPVDAAASSDQLNQKKLIDQVGLTSPDLRCQQLSRCVNSSINVTYLLIHLPTYLQPRDPHRGSVVVLSDIIKQISKRVQMGRLRWKLTQIHARWTLVRDAGRETQPRRWTGNTRRWPSCALNSVTLLTWAAAFAKSLYDDDLAIFRVRSELDNERTSSLEELRLD